MSVPAGNMQGRFLPLAVQLHRHGSSKPTTAFLSSTSCPLPVPNIPPALSSFSHFCRPARLSLRECCHWVNRAVLGGSFSVCHCPCGGGAELPNWAIKGYFHPRTSVSVGSSSKYRPGTSDAHEARLRFFSFLSFSPPLRLSRTHTGSNLLM